MGNNNVLDHAAQHLEATTKVTFLSVAVIIVVILIMHLWSQHGQNVEGMVQLFSYLDLICLTHFLNPVLSFTY